MTFLLNDQLMYALGWAVLHALWLGAVAGLLGALLMSALRKKSAAVRYRAAYGLLMVLFAAVATAGIVAYAEFDEQRDQPAALGFLIAQMSPTEAQMHSWQAIKHSFVSHCNERLPWIVSIWMVGLVIGLGRLLGGFWWLRRLKKQARPLQSEFWNEVTDYLSEKLGIQRVIAIAESAWMQTPVVVGHLKPVILLPVGMVNQLQPAQVEAILAHELAHVLRRDYLLNIIQSLVESLLYFHPAVWWLSALIRREREHCCDDLAIHACGMQPIVFVKALVQVQEHARTTRPMLALGFAGRRQHLLHRVQRLIQPTIGKSNNMEKSIASMLLFALLLCVSLGANTPARAALANVQETLSDLISRDTVPATTAKSRTKIALKDTDGKDVEMTMADGEITSLKVDGQEIPKEEYDRYTEVVEPLMAKHNGFVFPSDGSMGRDSFPRMGSYFFGTNDKHPGFIVFKGPKGGEKFTWMQGDNGFTIYRNDGIQILGDSIVWAGEPGETFFHFDTDNDALRLQLDQLRAQLDFQDPQIWLERLREGVEAEELARDAEELARQAEQMARDAEQMARDAEQMARDEEQMARDAEQMARDEEQMARDGATENSIERRKQLLEERREALREQQRELKRQEKELKRLKKLRDI